MPRALHLRPLSLSGSEAQRWYAARYASSTTMAVDTVVQDATEMAETVEAPFRYRLPLQAGEEKPHFDGMEQAAESDGSYDDELYSTPVCTVINARRMESQPTIDDGGFQLVHHPVEVSDWYSHADMAEHYHEPMKELVSKLLADSESFEAPMFVMTNGHLTRNEAEAEAGERLGAHHLVHNDFTPEFRDKIGQRTPMVDLFINNGAP